MYINLQLPPSPRISATTTRQFASFSQHVRGSLNCCLRPAPSGPNLSLRPCKPKNHSRSMSDAPTTAPAAPPAAVNGAPAAPTESGPAAAAAAAPAPEVGPAAPAASGAASANDAPAAPAKADADGGDEEPEEVDDEEAMLRAIEAEKAQEDAAEAAHPHAQPHEASAAPKLLQDAIKKAEVKFSDSEEEEEAQKKKAAESPSKEEKKDDDADNDAAAAAAKAEETHVHARVRTNVADEIDLMTCFQCVPRNPETVFRSSIFWCFVSFCTLMFARKSVADIRA